MNKEEFKELCKACKTQEELDIVCVNNVMIWYDDKELEGFIYLERGRLIKETNHI